MMESTTLVPAVGVPALLNSCNQQSTVPLLPRTAPYRLPALAFMLPAAAEELWNLVRAPPEVDTGPKVTETAVWLEAIVTGSEADMVVWPSESAAPATFVKFQIHSDALAAWGPWETGCWAHTITKLAKSTRSEYATSFFI